MRHEGWNLLLLGAALCGFVLTGCGDGGETADAGAAVDAGETQNDAGDTDAGPGEPDAGELDAGELDAGEPDAGVPSARTLPTQGSAIVLTGDDSVAIGANRQAGSLSVFSFVPGTPAMLARTADLDVGADEPWAAVVGNDDDTAYAILRRSQQVVRIDALHTAPALASTRGTTGAEPTGLAISPTGRRLYVANWSEGTVSVLDTATLATVGTVDLNAALVATGSLGPSAVARPGLAHPRALVVTNDGDTDDADETVYVTEYFGQARTDALPAGDAAIDVAKRGLVYRFGAGDLRVGAAIPLAPVDSTGFIDSNDAMTGCYPNQLQTATLDSGRLYVAGLCASPRGPTGPVAGMGGAVNGANFKTEVHTALFVVDVATNAELPTQRVLLTRAFQDRYDVGAVADDATRRMPLIATDLAFVPGGRIGYLTAYGSDAVFRVVFGTDGSLTEVGSTASNFINLAPGGTIAAGRLPMGLAITRGTVTQALVLNEASRNVSVVSFASQAVVSTAEATAMPADGSDEAHALEGRRLFVTGLGRWSLRGQAWNSCESCHGDALTDNVTWYFGRGPRQSTSLDGSYDSSDSTQRRVFNWTAIFDETHDFELNTRGNSGGVGAIVHAASTPLAAADRIHFDGTTPVPMGNMATATPQAGLAGSTTSMMPGGPNAVRSVLADWDRIDDYLQTIRSPRAPSNLVAADVTAGRALFEANQCAGCHGSSMWTISRVFYTPSESNNAASGTLRSTNYTAPGPFPRLLNPATDLMSRTAPLRFPAGMTAAANDQIQCVLRAVGTFPGTGENLVGPAGAPGREVRTNMMTPAQGATGFNPPSLLGLATGAPYFHAGNARTLEETFDATFQAHHTSLSTNFLLTGDRDTQIRQLVAFLLSIDEGTTAVAVPGVSALGYNPVLCPTAL